MGSLNALNARPHDDGFLNPCRRTSKVFCKTHLGLREEHAAAKKKKSGGVKARPRRPTMAEDCKKSLGRPFGLGLPPSK